MRCAVLCRVSALVLAGLLLCSCGKPATGSKARRNGEEPARPVRLAAVEMRPMERSIKATGTLAAYEESTLSAKVPGRLQQLMVDIGSVVRAGDVLAQIEPRDYELRLQQAGAALAQARVALGLPLDGDDDEIALDEVSSVKQAKAVLDEASKNQDRVARLLKSGIASDAEFDTVEATHTVAAASTRRRWKRRGCGWRLCLSDGPSTKSPANSSLTLRFGPHSTARCSRVRPAWANTWRRARRL